MGEYLKAKGANFGYYPKPVKIILIIKDNSLKQSAQKLFKNQGTKITAHGERYLGSFKEQYTKNKG